jgi:hypothetical protein
MDWRSYRLLRSRALRDPSAGPPQTGSWQAAGLALEGRRSAACGIRRICQHVELTYVNAAERAPGVVIEQCAQ